MSRRHKAKPKPQTDPVVDANVDECEHIDDNNDGVCDLCGVEVEVDSTHTEDPEPPAPEPAKVIDPPKDVEPKVMVPAPSDGKPKYVVRDNVGCPFYKGNTYKPGDVMPLTPDEYPSWKKFVDVR